MHAQNTDFLQMFRRVLSVKVDQYTLAFHKIVRLQVEIIYILGGVTILFVVENGTGQTSSWVYKIQMAYLADVTRN